MLTRGLFRQATSFFRRPILPFNSLAFPPTSSFSEFFRERDRAEWLVYEELRTMDKVYRRIKEGWEKPLEKKRLRRERREARQAEEVKIQAFLTNNGQERPEPEPEKFVIHNEAKGIELPVQDDGIFAVIQVGGSQHKVVKDDVIVAEYLEDYDINEQIVFEKVFLIGTKDYTSLGRPFVESARVYATVEEQTLSEKTLVFKKKRRKGYKRTFGSRQPLTVLRIDKIEHNLTPEIMERAVSLV